MKYALIFTLFAVACRHGNPQTPPEAAVARLTETIATHADFTQDDLYAAMEKAGIPASDADRAFKFTQIAWGRRYLAGLGDFKSRPTTYASTAQAT